MISTVSLRNLLCRASVTYQGGGTRREVLTGGVPARSTEPGVVENRGMKG